LYLIREGCSPPNSSQLVKQQQTSSQQRVTRVHTDITKRTTSESRNDTTKRTRQNKEKMVAHENFAGKTQRERTESGELLTFQFIDITRQQYKNNTESAETVD
jgi:hypothetical protein